MCTARPHRRRAGRLAALALSLTVALSVVAVGPAGAATKRVRREERAMRLMLNDARRRHHRDRLYMMRRVRHAARRHSRAMAHQGQLFHSEDLAPYMPRYWTIAGENVGVGGDIETLHRAFMGSPPHRENALRRAFERVGVGVVHRAGRLWVTFIFYG